ncbi:MAG TPA: type III pantothenate kinase [Pirellulales bacterium]|nr:type III pantothenate kinase [Pirellulales bacterium]
MTSPQREVIAAIDVGNSRIKVGLYLARDIAATADDALPQPIATHDLLPEADGLARLADQLAPHRPDDLAWWIGSVERTFASRFVDWLRTNGAQRIAMMACGDLPLVVSLPRPDMVGIDRLLAAVAINRLREPDRPAIIADLGTAITVDLVSADGAFLGGAILPGIAMAARSLHDFTDLLPQIEMAQLEEPPPALGASTVEAMRSGIYWGAVGGIRHLVELLTAAAASGDPQVFLTGGAAPAVASLISVKATYVPHLTLAGIALAAAEA